MIGNHWTEASLAVLWFVVIVVLVAREDYVLLVNKEPAEQSDREGSERDSVVGGECVTQSDTKSETWRRVKITHSGNTKVTWRGIK